MSNAIQTKNLKIGYDKVIIVPDFNIEFEKGKITSIIGANGCGKSTLLNIIGGLDTDYTGSVVIRGKFIRDYTEKQMDD